MEGTSSLGYQRSEPMETIKSDDKFTLAAYARDNNLLDQGGWKWARGITKNPQKFIRMARIFAAQMKRYGAKYKFGIRVPRNYREAVEIDRKNGNTLWQDTVNKEVAQIMDYKMFKIR